jgi:alpha-amylase/alpha-mannosidase (GH57 family)
MVKLAILWHMHQPYYEDLATGEHILPWVRLHAIKDYLGMVALLDEFPDVRVTFNLVPSLLVQVQAFAEERARDPHLEIGLKPADTLDATERASLVAHGFHAPFERMIRPYPRYAELHARRAAPQQFSEQDLRDLQVWQKLVWMDPDWLVRDERLVTLVRKGSGFTEDDKRVLREVELELLNGVIPAYAAAAARGQVELSTSPFYHPILPLLCDSDVHFRAQPQSALPRGLFRWPGDAREQLARAVRLHTGLFGAPPRGVWPSEGSVSDAALEAIAATGVEWVATDEGILARSLGGPLSPNQLYRPYGVGPAQHELRCLFRDHGLSDMIGFSYQSWDADAAAEDFIRRVIECGRRFEVAGGTGEPVVCVILDGENAWEHYAGGGRPFLRALYSRLTASPHIRTVTMAEAAAGPAGRLDSIFPGSWINSDFYIWAGHADDHRAWSQLAAARRAYEERANTVGEAERERAYEELLIAEGSDWFWWYGDDHSSDHDREFDELFRTHLRNVYRALNLPVPDDLYVSNITTRVAGGAIQPRAYIDPVLDGDVTSFAEWAGAVPVALGTGASTMHRVTSELVHDLLIGLGPADVFVRVDGEALVRGLLGRQLGLALLLGAEVPRRFDLWPHANGTRTAVGRIVEAAVPLEHLGVAPGARARLSLLVTDAEGHVIEQHPSGSPIELDVPTVDLDAANWTV